MNSSSSIRPASLLDRSYFLFQRLKASVWRKGRAGGNAAAAVGVSIQPTGNPNSADFSPGMGLLERAFSRVENLKAAAAEDGKCSACGSDSAEPLECMICKEECCASCAPSGLCQKCQDEDEDPAATITPSSSVSLADGPARRLQVEAMAPAPAAAPVIPAGALPAAAPVPAFSASAEISRLQAAIPGTPCSKERYRMQEHIEALESGKSSKPFLHQNQIDERQRVLSLEQGKATTSAEKWRIGNQIEQLGQGIDPGPFVPAQLIAASVAALEADLATETDSAAVWEILAHIDAIKAGVPFVSREEKARRRAELEAKLETATSNRDRFNLAAEIDNL